MATDIRRASGETAQQQGPRRANRVKAAYLLSEKDENLLKQLPGRYAQVLRQEGSMQELSRQLQIPIGTVKSRIHRARIALDELKDRAGGVPKDDEA